ncbi:DUF1760-domain-containing protein [Metschnikowia bicuspidata var. bicuspidata NRRL YB-4993]|uniref:DUF1760-domain-containing protein n=1 Tax=Metschnikowia bicuspidata var. bicuspidata NRRL YB-4993 TaxID=869754 RepID=A0A1A0HG20_9ASCO|nr:DUF1760-domain-containing protein [Metschnikowia bicuspidata var. bicuspidata NRRL YB-4993]OBA22842.1 DUF1760-domain-containing protein [Metschnikowia bicuspidata var. bicuspidata NRRL YB-4993]
MSDSEAEVSLVSSGGTLEAFNLDQILQVLKDSAQDAIETKDFLSYSTVLDIHLSELGRFSADEREILLQQLLDSLSSNHELVAEVGWDIPALLIPFVDSDFAFVGGIRDAPCVYKVLKIFEVLALHGNAKELFLKSTELLSSLKRDERAENPLFAEKFYEIKLYCIFELITSSMRRVHTLYPSRFLAMTVSSFINQLFLNPLDDPTSFNFVMKRMYGFARNYVSPPKPEKTDLPAEDLKKIEDDENFLLRKLLTALLTEGTFMAMRLTWIGFTVSYFNHLHKILVVDQKSVLDYELDMPVLNRLNELALSFDLAPHQDFEDFVTLSEKLVDFDAAAASEGESFSSELFERLVVDYQNLFSNCIVNAKTGAVADSLGGNLLLYTYEMSSRNAVGAANISLKQSIAMAIRVIVPGIVHPSLHHRGMLDLAVFWCWHVVQTLLKKPKQLELELSSVPKVIMVTFLQALVYAVSSTSPSSKFRYVTLTLLTKVLSAVPEDAAYSFIINALRECPFKGAKPVLVGVLRVLIVSDKKVDELSETLGSLDIGKDSSENKSAPPLPARTPKEKTKFITLTKTRTEDILSLVDQYINLTFEECDGVTQPEKLERITNMTEKNVSLVEENFKGEGQNRIPLNAVMVLRVALTRLSE